MENSLNLFKIQNIQISIHHTWLIVFLLVGWSLAAGYYPQKILNLAPSSYWIMGGLSSLLLFICVLLHELSHSIIAMRNGMEIHQITLFIFGGVAEIKGEPQTAWTEFKIAIAGPLCSIVLGLFFFAVEWLCSFLLVHPAVTLVLSYLALINLTLAAFNLVPGFPLDGGRVLRAFFWMRSKNFSYATRVAVASGKAVAYVLIAFGAVQIIGGSITGGIWLGLIGLFLQFAAQGSAQHLQLRQYLYGLTVSDLMKFPVITVGSDLFLDHLVKHYFLSYQYKSFPVVSAGSVVGTISLSDVKSVPPRRWSMVRVGEVMSMLSPHVIIHPDEDALEVFNRMVREHKDKLPVVRSGMLVGVITRRDMRNLVKIKSLGGTPLRFVREPLRSGNNPAYSDKPYAEREHTFNHGF